MEVENGAEVPANDPTDEQIPKKGRHRKKQLFVSIRNQMEFYFSDSNLSKDRFLGQRLKESPYIDLDLFLSFNKVRKLTTSIEDLRTALKHSTLIGLSEDGNSVCRKEPLKVKSNVDECTIYVERLKADATHEWLSSVFSEFGKVMYVSIPKYKHSSNIKGFAFVEFDTENEARNALSYFESIGAKMPSDVDPQNMLSIKTFLENQQEDETKDENDGKKRKLDEISEDPEDESNKKLKTEGDIAEVPETDPESENKKKKKLKKEHKKKNHIKELGLQVLAKVDWKKMRNRYLNMQHKKMKEFKQHLHKVKFSQQNYDEKTKKPVENVESTEEVTAPPTKLDFTEGVIVKMEFAEPFLDPKKTKNEIKASSTDIKFVDLSAPTCELVFVRFGSSKGAKDFSSSDFNGATKVLLEGDEEKLYWEKILTDRDTKFQKTAKKQRGRDKLLKKANKLMATHIKFDE